MELSAKIDYIISQISEISKNCKDGTITAGNSKPQSRVEDLKKEIEDLKKILLSDNATSKEIDDANIRLEKAISAYESHPEVQEMSKRMKLEKEKRNEPLNREALIRVKQYINPESLKTNPEMLKRY